MRATLGRLASVLRLTRVTSAVAIVGNLWFVVLWTRAHPEEPGTPEIAERSLWLLLPAAAFAGVSLFAYAAALNDILDRKRDRSIQPGRPIAAGQIQVEQAATVVAVTLIAAVLGSSAFGTTAVILTLALAAAVLFFNAIARFIPAIGFLTLGLIYAGHMLVPNYQLVFVVPLLLVMSHALAVAAATHLIARKVPRVTRRAALAAIAGWVVWIALLLGLGTLRNHSSAGAWPDWIAVNAAILPGVCVLAFVLVAFWKQRQIGGGPRAAEKIQRYGSLWLTLYGAAWLLSTGAKSGAAIMAGLALVGFMGMTTLRELYGLLEEPIGYRR